jgi:hypothetical protein
MVFPVAMYVVPPRGFIMDSVLAQVRDCPVEVRTGQRYVLMKVSKVDRKEHLMNPKMNC